ncbi:MAG: hypothetical protein LBO00_04860 [Zoogloeaceae bacterium]|nr:hypothetical protein [Zoogloeaceae bacterium]
MKETPALPSHALDSHCQTGLGEDLPSVELPSVVPAGAHAVEACALLKALANADHLMLLCRMSATPRNVGELEAATGIRQPSLSQQL